jgi:hypothetical protein
MCSTAQIPLGPYNIPIHKKIKAGFVLFGLAAVEWTAVKETPQTSLKEATIYTPILSVTDRDRRNIYALSLSVILQY